MIRRRYLVIAPGRNEAKYMRRTLDALKAQTVPPSLLVVVDDGSTDETPAILREYAASWPALSIVTRPDRGKRSVGPGVIETFYAGLATVNLDDFDYVCKLDLDLDLPRGYFEELIRHMEADPRLGTISGKPFFPGPSNPRGEFGAELIPEVIGDETSAGMTKFYRVTCFRQIGGFVRQVMWDGIDNHRCRMLGWHACSLDDPALRFVHLRPMGSSHMGIWTGRKRHGFGQYFMGTSPAFITASAVYRLAKRPYLIGAVAMWWGYVASMIRREPRYGDLPFRTFLRRYQLESLFIGKRRAVTRAARRAAHAWDPADAAQRRLPEEATTTVR
jgi:biofilm PGA synthesis N-glycosyltransferase PgaC